MLHVGTNDSCNNTSDVILNELIKLGAYLEMALPDSKVILSLPTIRTDNYKANTITRNLKRKAKNMKFILLENWNINESHISKRGLHFNGHGIRKMAGNIISLTKRL